MFPSADEIATAIVEASRLMGENPVSVVGGISGMRSRHIAFDALRMRFPDASRASMARCCGYAKPKSAAVLVCNARAQQWWSDDHVDEVFGALVPEEREREIGAADAG